MHTGVHSSSVHNSQDMEAPKCPSADEWIEDKLHIYNGILLNHENEIVPFSTKGGPRVIILSGVSQPDKDKCHVVSLTCAT